MKILQISFLFLFLFSCGKSTDEEFSIVDSHSNYIQEEYDKDKLFEQLQELVLIENKMMSFKSFENLDEFESQISELTFNDRLEFYESLNFESEFKVFLGSIISNKSGVDEEVVAKQLLTDFSAVRNQNNLFMVDNIYYKFENKKLYATDNQEDVKLNKFVDLNYEEVYPSNKKGYFLQRSLTAYSDGNLFRLHSWFKKWSTWNSVCSSYGETSQVFYYRAYLGSWNPDGDGHFANLRARYKIGNGQMSQFIDLNAPHYKGTSTFYQRFKTSYACGYPGFSVDGPAIGYIMGHNFTKVNVSIH